MTKVVKSKLHINYQTISRVGSQYNNQRRTYLPRSHNHHKCKFYLKFSNYIRSITKRSVLNQPISHRVPLNPGAHVHLNPFTRSVQVPLLRQGLLAHSSTSILKTKQQKRMLILTVF